MSGPKHTLWRYDPRSGRVWSSEGESIALISPPKGILPPTEPGEALIEWQKRVRPQFAAYEAEKARRGQLLAAAPRLAEELSDLAKHLEEHDPQGDVQAWLRSLLDYHLPQARAALREAGVPDA